jgi:hypothetical protein
MKQFPFQEITEFRIFKKLNTPEKIQDFLNTFPFNFETSGDTNMSPLSTLHAGTAHCMEGAMLSAAILWYHGQKPLLLDLKASNDDFDHVVTLFKHDGLWGALSKTNHGVLRYRDPIYKNIRELVMSYFHEYFLNSSGKKTLRSYSVPFDLSKLDTHWLTSQKNLWNIVVALEKSPHTDILSKQSIKKLRNAESIEIQLGSIVQEKKASNFPNTTE